MTSLELLQGIELWLSVKREPSKKEVDEYLMEIREHIEEALAISRVVSMYSCGNCGSEDIDKEESFCNNCSEYLDY